MVAGGPDKKAPGSSGSRARMRRLRGRLGGARHDYPRIAREPSIRMVRIIVVSTLDVMPASSVCWVAFACGVLYDRFS